MRDLIFFACIAVAASAAGMPDKAVPVPSWPWRDAEAFAQWASSGVPGDAVALPAEFDSSVLVSLGDTTEPAR